MEFHIPPLAAEVLFSIGPLPITNSFINALLVTVFLVAVGYVATRRLAIVPAGSQHVMEVLLETILEYMDRVTQSREKSVRFLPFIGTLFLFIMLSNFLGIFPGIGSIGRTVTENGHSEFLPLFRPANTDLNLTLAMAVLTVVTSHVLGVFAIGFWNYTDRFVKVRTLWRSLRQGGMNIVVAVIEFGVGLIEIVSEVAKMASLSLRLFGNIFAGEVLLTVIATLVPIAIPLPFMMMELLVGVIQATVFSMLALVYLTMATSSHEAEAHHG